MSDDKEEKKPTAHVHGAVPAQRISTLADAQSQLSPRKRKRSHLNNYCNRLIKKLYGTYSSRAMSQIRKINMILDELIEKLPLDLTDAEKDLLKETTLKKKVKEKFVNERKKSRRGVKLKQKREERKRNVCLFLKDLI